MADKGSWLGDILKEVSLFDGLDDDTRRKIFESGKVKKYKSDQLVMKEGDPSDKIFVIIDGKARVSRRTGQSEQRVLAFLERGSVFGEMAAFDGLGHSADVYADGEMSALTIDNEKFFKLLRNDAELALKITTRIISTLSMRLRKTNDQLLGR